MIDRLVRGLFPSRGLRALLVRVGDISRMARVLHGLTPTTGRLFAELLAGGALVGALQKEAGTRVSLQLEGDGPVRGLFVDADTDGNVRGYVRAPGVDLPGDPAGAARAALGPSGYLSVIRDLGGGKFYRSAVALGGDGVPGVLRRWFAVSEQVETALDVCVLPRGDEPLGDVVGLLVQRLPDGDAAGVAALRQALAGGALARALTGAAGTLAGAAVARSAGAGAQEVLAAVAGPGFELLTDQEVAYRCGCSPARARAAVSALGADGVAEVLAEDGRAEVSCEFCHAHYVLDREALETLLVRLREDGPAGDPA